MSPLRRKEMKMDSSTIADAFETLGGDADEAINASREFSSTQTWIGWQSSQVAVSGAAATAVPFLHVVTLTADVAFVLHKVAYCAWGVGALSGCDVEAKDDLGVVLGLWSGAVTERHLAETVQAAASGDARSMAGAAAVAAGTVAGAAGVGLAMANPKLAGKGLGLFAPLVLKKAFGVAVPVGTVPAGKLLVKKIAPKLTPKLAAKVGAKGMAGFVPVLGAAVGASVNAYIVGHTGQLAERCYEHKRQFQEAFAASM